jgi:hypothetical protein
VVLSGAAVLRDPLTVTPAHLAVVMAVCALTAYLANRAVAVFNDGVRPFMLDYRNGGLPARQVALAGLRLASGFVLGVGVFVGVASGTLNPFLLFLPTDVLGILAPRRWLAPVLGAAWGALAFLGLGLAYRGALELPVDVIGAISPVLQPILYLFPLFPVIAIGYQYGRVRAVAAMVVTTAVLVTAGTAWSALTARWLALSAGVALLLFWAGREELTARRARVRAVDAEEARPADGGPNPVEDLFREHAHGMRRRLPLFAVLGAGVALLANQHLFAGGEVSGFAIRDGAFGSAAQLDLFRALAYIPMLATAALATGCYGASGLLFVYTVGYLAPAPWVAVLGGAVLLVLEVLLLPHLRRAFTAAPALRDVSDNVRNAMYLTFETALLVGSVLAGAQMAAGLGILLVGGLYLLNETLGRPILRMAAGPAAALIAGLVLNVLHWLHAVPRWGT